MAFPSIPQNFYVQQGNNQVYLSWDISTGSTSYTVQRSTDGVNYSTLSTPAVNNYLDTSVILGVQYFYQVAATNTGGTSPYTPPQSVVPAPVAEMSLGQIRLMAQERADRVNSNFVTLPEWNLFINQAMYELYDLMITVYDDYFKAPSASFTSNGTQQIFPLPDGVLTFLDDNRQPFVAKPFYKLLGVDLALNTANNAYVTVNRYNFIDRNRFVYPNTASTIYGVFNLQYRLMGSNIEFIPTPSGGQIIRLQYVPRLSALLKDTDLTTIGQSGWLQYVIIRAAKYALDKEESDTTTLTQELLFLKSRIEESATNRDIGQADTISDTRQGNWADGWFGGRNGAIGGWAVLAMPNFHTNNVSYSTSLHAVPISNFSLAVISCCIGFAYFIYLNRSKFGSRVTFPKLCDFFSHSSSAFFSHICHIISSSTKKQMVRANTNRIITFMTNIKSIIKSTVSDLVSSSGSNTPSPLCPKLRSTISIKVAGPNPTLARFIDLTPKSISQRDTLTHTKSISTINQNVNRRQ